MSHDDRDQAYKWAGPGNEKYVDAIAADLHYNESIHMHNLGDEKEQHGACTYCWLRAGRAVRALVRRGAEMAAVSSESAGSAAD